MSYTTVNKSTDHFNVKLWTGNSGTQSITGVGFRPDLIWGKVRADNNNTGENGHMLIDAVRGNTKYLQSNTAAAEATNSYTVTSFDSDGFSVGNKAELNSNTNTYVGWNWKAGNSSGSSNSDGSISSTVSVNTTAGFSIVKYTGTNGTATVGHGLGVEPSFIIFKCLDNGNKNWVVYHKDLTNAGSIYLDQDSASSTSYDYFADTSPTSTVFTVKKDSSYNEVNNNGSNFIAYCFAEKPGFSSFGSYTANNSNDGPFLFCGMKPAYVVTKCTSATSHWNCFDNKRSPFNDRDDYHKLNEPTTEDTGSSNIQVDFLSNGFKIRGNNNEINGSSRSYIYFAFSAAPLVGTNNIPATGN